MQQERIYVGIRRDGQWRVMAIDEVSDADLAGLNLRRDFQSTVTVGRDSRAARQQIKLQHDAAQNPFQALATAVPSSPALEALRERARLVAPELFES